MQLILVLSLMFWGDKDHEAVATEADFDSHFRWRLRPIGGNPVQTCIVKSEKLSVFRNEVQKSDLVKIYLP